MDFSFLKTWSSVAQVGFKLTNRECLWSSDLPSAGLTDPCLSVCLFLLNAVLHQTWDSMPTSKMYLSAVPVVGVKYLNKLFGNISVTLYSIAAMVVSDKARWGGGNGVLLCTLLNTPPICTYSLTRVSNIRDTCVVSRWPHPKCIL